MNWSVLSEYSFDTNDGGHAVIVGASVYIVMLSLDTDNVSMEGDIMNNIFYWGFILLCFSLNIRVC